MGAPASPSGSRASTEPVPVSAASGFDPSRKTIEVADFRAQLSAQGVSSPRHYALVCPACKTVQSMASLVAAGATPGEAERRIGFSCEGRISKARGCDWSLGGLFQIHTLEVVTEDGEHHPRFEIATPEQAQELAIATEARRAETVKHGSVHEGAGRETALPKGGQQ